MSGKKHHPYGPSGAYRWLTCPGSVELSRGVESRESSYAAQGQAAHDYMETYLANRYGLEIDGVVPDALDTSNAPNVQLLIDTVARIYDAFPEPPTIRVEHHIESSSIAEFGGTVDVLISGLIKNRLHVFVIDLKYGEGIEVEATGNPQLLSYMLLAREDMFENARVDAVFHGFIVQPRVHGQKVKGMTATMEDLDGFRDIVIQAKERNEFKAGDHCRFCPAITNCQTVADHALSVAQESFGSAPASAEEKERWVQLMAVKSAVTKLYEELPKRMLVEIKRGNDVPGYKAVEALGNRTWTNETIVANRLADADIDPYEPRKLLTPPKVEKLLGKEDFAELQPLIVRPSKGVTLAPEKDKRPAVNFSPIEDSFELAG